MCTNQNLFMNIKAKLNIKQDMLNNENYTLLLKFNKYFKLYIFTVYLYSKETKCIKQVTMNVFELK